MKKILLFLVASFVVISSFAQTNIPQLVSFSAVVRDANNVPLANTPVSIRLTFKQGGASGPLVYCALHQSTTNQNGFISIQLNRDVLGTGCNGAPSNAFQNIPWENGGFWMEVEYQTIPGSPFVNLGQLELASSFYAFAAGTAERIASITTAGAQNGDVLVYNSTSGKFEPGQSGITSVQWANVQNKPNFATVATSGDYGDLINTPSIPTVPTNVSAFTNDAGYVIDVTETDPIFTTWNKDYNDLINTPSIPIVPSNISAFINDAAYLTANEYQTLNLSNDTLYLTNGGFVKLPSVTSPLLQPPTVTPQAASNVQSFWAKLNGTVNANGLRSTVVFEWGLTTSYGNTVIASQSNVSGTSDVAVVAYISNLQSNTTYHFRIKATNAVEVTYSSDMSFTTTAAGGIITNPGAGVMFNGYTYGSIVLGNEQEWMAENLRTTVYANGDTIPNVTDNTQWSNLTTGAWAHYNNDSQYENPYGKLYNWHTVADQRNVCPIGWHVPTDAEWSVLIDYLGGSSLAGIKMKSMGTQYWQSPNTNSTNESGFSALPGGIRSSNGSFNINNIGNMADWWSSTEDSASNAWDRYLTSSNDFVQKSSNSKKCGFSVRCIRD